MLINLDKSENIIKKYYRILNLIDSIKIDYNITRLDLTDEEKKNQLDKNIYGKFIINDIRDEIMKMNYIYYVTFGSNYIYIFSHSYISRNSIKLKALIKIIIYLQKIGNKDILNSYLYLTTSEREIHDKCFNAKAVNGGYTKFHNKKMVVWRREDGLKVFIHELIHYFDIDLKFRKYGDVNNYTSNNITKNTDYSFEAFTDFIALNYYMVYLSLIEENFDINFLHKNFCNQYNFSLNQGFKIIKYSNLSEGCLIKNTTNVYSYYLLKLYLMIYHRNDNLNEINIKNLILNSYDLFTKPLFKKYIKKIKLDNKINMAYHQVYL